MFYQNISEPFMLSVRRFPDTTALIFEGQRLSYSQANSRINRISNGLVALGV